MANVVSTLLQLLARWVDNTVGSITAQDGRNLLVSAFGYQGTGVPSANNDNVDTAGLGAFFDAGSRWEDTSTGRPYFCADGTPGAAVWLAMMFDGQTAGGALGGAYPNPALSNTGVTSGVYGDSTHYPIFTVNPDGRLFAASQGLLPSPGAGTVTSVGLALPGEFTVTGTPVNTAGTLTGAWANQSANTFFRGPTSGGAATPGFGALVAADIPTIAKSQISSAGTFPASEIAAGYPYGNLSGAPAAGASMHFDTATTTTGAAYVALVNYTSATGILGCWTLSNVDAALHSLTYKITATDAFGNTDNTGDVTMFNANNNVRSWDGQMLIGGTNLFPPFTSLKIEVKNGTGANINVQYKFRSALVF